MSERTRDLPRRSCHAVPGSNPRFVEKAQGLEVDMVFLDLEDSVAPKEKEGARAVVADAIKNGNWGDKVVCVRVNDWSTKWTVFDIIEVVTRSGERLDEIMLPKVENAAQVVAADMVLRQCEIQAGLPIGHNGIEVIDGPFLQVRDQDALREYCQRARVLGYDGKWTLHPDQVPVVNDVFSPTQEQFDKAWEILDAYEQATEGEGRGAVMFGDEMIDEASRKMALKFVTRGERAGLSRSAS